MIKYTFQGYEQLPEYEIQPPGVYWFKTMYAEQALQGGNGKTAGSQVIIVRIAIANNNGEIVNQFKERFILHPATAWKWEAFLECINFNNGDLKGGMELGIELRDIVGRRGKARVGIETYEVKQSNGSKAFLPQGQQPHAANRPETRDKNKVDSWLDNQRCQVDEQVLAEFDRKMEQMERAAQDQQNSFYPPSSDAPPPAQRPQQQPQSSPFPPPKNGQQSMPGYPQPDLPSDDDAPPF